MYVGTKYFTILASSAPGTTAYPPLTGAAAIRMPAPPRTQDHKTVTHTECMGRMQLLSLLAWVLKHSSITGQPLPSLPAAL
jgi:hypothetical protein